MTKAKVDKNNIVRLKLLLEDVKDKLHMDEQKTYGGLYDRGRIEITEFQDQVFKINTSNFKTKSFNFKKIKEHENEDLRQAWLQVFGYDVELQIL